jgi:hypothetical protein
MPRDDKLRPQFILDRTVRSDRTVHRGVGAARAPMPDVCYANAAQSRCTQREIMQGRKGHVIRLVHIFVDMTPVTDEKPFQ